MLCSRVGFWHSYIPFLSLVLSKCFFTNRASQNDEKSVFVLRLEAERVLEPPTEADAACWSWSAPSTGSSKPLTRHYCNLSPFHNRSMMSSFANGQFVNARRERSYDFTASTNDCRPATAWQGRAYPTGLCP